MCIRDRHEAACKLIEQNIPEMDVYSIDQMTGSREGIKDVYKRQGLTFFPGYERTFGEEETEGTLQRFLAFAEQTDFSEWDYGVEYEVGEGAPEEISRKGMTGQVQAYRNRKQTVFQAEMSGGTFYYNQGEGILHCDTAEGTGPWDGQACVWEDFPFDAVNQRGNEMLHTLLASGEFTDVVCEYVDALSLIHIFSL